MRLRAWMSMQNRIYETIKNKKFNELIIFDEMAGENT